MKPEKEILRTVHPCIHKVMEVDAALLWPSPLAETRDWNLLEKNW